MSCDFYAIFGNRVRSKLITCLSGKAKNVTQLIKICGLSQSAVSQHLAKLRQSGIVQTTKDGKEVFYHLTTRKAARVAELLKELEE